MSRHQTVWQVSYAVGILFVGRHGHQLKGLILFVSGVILAQHASLAMISGYVVEPGQKAPSMERRLQRFLANTRIVHTNWCRQMTRVMALAWRGDLRLVLDETTQGKETVHREGKKTYSTGRVVIVKVSLVYRGRSLPLMWYSATPRGARARRTQALLRLVAACLPPDAPVILMCDRGLSSPALVDLCKRLHWSFVLRVNGNGKLLRSCGNECWLSELVPQPGTRWYGNGQVYKDAGWRTTNVVALWKPGYKDPLILLTNRPPCYRRAAEYFDRTTIEETFRDLKSSGWNWQKSRIPSPAHMDRLLLALVVALWVVLNLGAHVIKRGWRSQFERRDRRIYSLCQLGLKWLARDYPRTTPFPLSFYHTPLVS